MKLAIGLSLAIYSTTAFAWNFEEFKYKEKCRGKDVVISLLILTVIRCPTKPSSQFNVLSSQIRYPSLHRI